jgi:hypothetical protein
VELTAVVGFANLTARGNTVGGGVAMRVTLLGHASVLGERNGVTPLMDPVLGKRT